MGIYLNPGNELFQEARNAEIYIDKSGLISYTNKVFGSPQKYVCVSRPRRFGKSMAAEMLTSYYGRGCSSRELFQGLNVATDPSFEEHLNKHDVIFLNMQKFLSRAKDAGSMVDYLQEKVLEELKEAYPDCIKSLDVTRESKILAIALEKVYDVTKNPFVFIIDEWDCIFREKQYDTDAQTEYLDFLRDLLKDAKYAKLAYMTGILPIKKYGSHSALNMFTEFSMTNPKVLAEYVGFTEDEVKRLCGRYKMDFEEAARWYDGYRFKRTTHIYSPKSVVDAMLNEEFDNYWTQTETYEALKIYIEMNFNGLKDAVIRMLSGGRCKINTNTFTNDMTTFSGKDDILTLLIHLGYLAYDASSKEVSIPNYEVSNEFVSAVEGAGWDTLPLSTFRHSVV